MQYLWPAVSLIALTIIVVVLFRARRGGTQRPSLFSPATLGMFLVVLGILFSENRTLSYLLMGAGVLLALTEAVTRRKK